MTEVNDLTWNEAIDADPGMGILAFEFDVPKAGKYTLSVYGTGFRITEGTSMDIGCAPEIRSGEPWLVTEEIV